MYVGCTVEEYLTSIEKGENHSEYYPELSLQTTTEFRFLIALNKKTEVVNGRLKAIAEARFEYNLLSAWWHFAQCQLEESIGVLGFVYSEDGNLATLVYSEYVNLAGIEAIISEFSPGVFIQQKLIFLDTSKGVASNLCPHSADATEVHAFVVQAVSDMLEIVALGILKGCGLSHKGINNVWKVLELQLSWQLVMGKDVEMLKLAP
ncbi:Endoribonuclease YBEY, chloroplastic [Sesamum angolense]|uniref:Endoribonuclease YBEY, chloroplastic n=1 Tax=Sesamum angolense TaxID=2727404 RepID=A0AAE2BJD1_9LAMI|nr:Endoribonuclease YBEY, chloroplastic [Sesamum angolense]